MRYKHTTHHTHTLDTPFGEVEIQYSADMADWDGALAHREGDHLVVAYLSYDRDGNAFGEPFHDGDGYIVGRGKYANRNHPEEELFEALGLDRYGDPDYGLVHDKVNDAWKDYVDSVSDDTWYQFAKSLGYPVPEDGDGDYREYINKWRDELGSVNVAWEGDVKYVVMEANKYVSWGFDPSNDDCRRAATHLDFNVEQTIERFWRDDGSIGNPYAVMLDVYDHSGIVWSVSGRGMNCRWDTSRGAGVWLPDEEAKDEIERRAKVYAVNYIRETPICLKGSDNKYQLVDVTTNNSIAMSDSWYDLWQIAEKYAEAAGDLTPAQIQIGRQVAAEELASQAVETYNSWSSGDIYGVIVEHFDNVAEPGEEPNWERTDDDACWGHIGSDFAKENMTMEFESAVKRLQNATVTAE